MAPASPVTFSEVKGEDAGEGADVDADAVGREKPGGRALGLSG
jgi:hypothetical protein